MTIKERPIKKYFTTHHSTRLCDVQNELIVLFFKGCRQCNFTLQQARNSVRLVLQMALMYA
ncbi:Uncharacterised protein [Klebsiella pneumoniae]|uniref:Uncharacterized protein n=1 Tax=Klebsiella pneumoniae TaxID=573 RepID=A0A3S4H5I5_KLEPN|nr:Uncharacterised protein [Klebsiella pneumoniae]